MAEAPAYLRLPRLETKAKRVELSSNYRRARSLTAAAESDLIALIQMIADGSPIPPRYYRRNLDKTPDTLLQRTGIMHLHLAGQGSDELVYVVQFEDFVLILETNTHAHFQGEPPGRALSSLHYTPISRAIWLAEQRRAAKSKGFERLRMKRLNRRQELKPSKE